MKKTISLLLVFALFLCVCGCHHEDNTWAPGQIEGDTYVSEFAKIRFVKDGSWVFETKTEGNIEDSFLDMVATYDTINRVEIGFNKAESPAHESAKAFIEDMTKVLSDTGWKFDKVTEKEFCGQKYFCVDGLLNVDTYRCYARTINNYIVWVNIFAVNTDIDTIEAMFYEL